MSARKLTSTALASLCAMAGLLALWAAPGRAEDRHEYLFQFSEVPAVGPHGEAVPVPGPLANPHSMTFDSGEVYVTEPTVGGGPTRVDKFNAATGAFISQLAQVPLPIVYLDQGVAVGHAAGEPEAYVAGDELGEGGSETDRGVVAVFDAAGNLRTIWRGAETLSKGFHCFECQATGDVAVDNSGVGWAAGDVYVADPENSVVDVFEPETGGGEKKPVAELTGTSPSEPFTMPYKVAVSEADGEVLVADLGNGVDIFKPTALSGQYEFVGKLAFPSELPPGARLSSIAANDGEGDIYVVGEGQVFEFNAAGVFVGRIGPETAPNGTFGENHLPSSVTADPATHRVFLGTENGAPPDPVFVFGPNVVFPDVATSPASNVKPTSATLNGTVNLDKAGPASCRFDWGTSKAFGEEALCPGKVEAEGTVPVSVPLSKLQPDTTYYYRLQATNANGTNLGEPAQDMEFTTPGPGLRDESASDVASTSATLDALINPNKLPTSYYFQYGRSAEYEAEIPLAPGALLGSGEGDLEVSRHLQGLAAGVVYHYRVVVVSELEVEGSLGPVAFPGPDRTFTTQAPGGGFTLPDGRQWEQVSPVDKRGALLEPIGENAVIQSSVSGDAISYLGTAATESGAQGLAWDEQILSVRGPSGWSSRDIATPHASPSGVNLAGGREYRFFSADLSLGLVEPKGGFTPLAPNGSPPDTQRTDYLRNNFTCGTAPASCYTPLLTGAPGYADVPPGTEFGAGFGEDNAFTAAMFVGATPDLAHVVLSSTVALTNRAIGPMPGLYEWSSGRPPAEQVQLVGVLPNDELEEKDQPELGTSNNPAHTISADGSRIVWSGLGSGDLYLRDMVKRMTIKLDVVQPGGSGSGAPNARFATASSDESKVFFEDEQRLTAASGESDLYECDIVEAADELKCELSDLTPSKSGEGAGIVGVVGASEDGSWVYFLAKGVLAEHAIPGGCSPGGSSEDTTCNLYVWHRGATRLIAVLSGEDFVGLGTARVSPDGGRLAFMSQRSLTGYDTRDAVSGKLDEEVYLYDANGNAGGGRLVCASCNPTSARPLGVEYRKLNGGLAGGDRVWDYGTWLAANIPNKIFYRASRSLYQSRYLSDEGRLFFNSSDALVPQDINGNEDVYEYEPAGVGGCSTASATFSESSGGCVGLISSGTSAGESGFMDASENGNDVFFLTSEQLVSGDADTAVDLYDARVCTAQAPCPNPPSPSPACTTADACRAAPSPQPAVFGAPSSATFSGAGSVTPPTSGPAVHRRSPTQAQRLARALAACHKRPKRKQRAVCERQARKRYGAAGRSRKTNATKRGRG